MKLTPFHLAIQVRDLDEAREFYGQQLGLPEGRSSEQWVDFNLYGHQLVTHLNPNIGKQGQLENHANGVDGHAVPVPHFGVVLEMQDWLELQQKVEGFIEQFIIQPYVRFKHQPGEQATMFFTDPSGNALEFKAFKDIEQQLFEK